MFQSLVLEAVDAIAGKGIYRRADDWYIVALDAGWRSRRIAGMRDALRHILTSTAAADGHSFSTETELVSYVRGLWLQEMDMPLVEVDEVRDLLPMTPRRNRPWPRVTRKELQWRPPSMPFDLVHVADAGRMKEVYSLCRTVALGMVEPDEPAGDFIDDLSSSVSVRVLASRTQDPNLERRADLESACRSLVTRELSWARVQHGDPPVYEDLFTAALSTERYPIQDEAAVAVFDDLREDVSAAPALPGELDSFQGDIEDLIYSRTLAALKGGDLTPLHCDLIIAAWPELREHVAFSTMAPRDKAAASNTRQLRRAYAALAGATIVRLKHDLAAARAGRNLESVTSLRAALARVEQSPKHHRKPKA